MLESDCFQSLQHNFSQIITHSIFFCHFFFFIFIYTFFCLVFQPKIVATRNRKWWAIIERKKWMPLRHLSNDVNENCNWFPFRSGFCHKTLIHLEIILPQIVVRYWLLCGGIRFTVRCLSGFVVVVAYYVLSTQSAYSYIYSSRKVIPHVP